MATDNQDFFPPYIKTHIQQNTITECDRLLCCIHKSKGKLQLCNSVWTAAITKLPTKLVFGFYFFSKKKDYFHNTSNFPN